MTLESYVSNIMQDITKARVQSDMETVRMAELYAKNDLLKHFSVPRFRMPSIEIDIPVAIDHTKNNQITKYEPVSDEQLINSTFLAFNDFYQERYGKKLVSVSEFRLKGSYANLIPDLKTMLERNIELEQILDNYANKVSEVSITSMKLNLARKINVLEGKALPELIKNKLKPFFVRKPFDSSSLNVIVETARLRELGDPQNLMRIKLNITEDGMEWINEQNNDGSIKNLLLPE